MWPILAAAAAVVYMISRDETVGTVAARSVAAIRSVERRPKQAGMLKAQASLETAAFDSAALRATNSLFNIHLAPENRGYGDYDKSRPAYVTPRGEHLRQYVTLEQSVRDMVGYVLRLPRYKEARAAYEAGDAPAYFAAVARGNGVEGFVGPSNAQKARDYVAGLTRVYRQGAV